MNNTFTIDTLAAWIDDLKKFAEGDHELLVAWFKDTKNQPFSITGGWQKMFTKDDYSDLFCCSKAQPEYVMCVKIIKNEGPYAYADFDSLDMPYDPETGDVDDTCIPLEWDDNPKCAAEFFSHEWERLMDTYGDN